MGGALQVVKAALRSDPFREAWRLTVEVEVEPTIARRLLPMGLWLTRPPRATLLFARYTPRFTEPYSEAGVFLHVRTPLGAGIHTAWMVVDCDIVLFYGRGLVGYPKKLAAFTWEQEDDQLRVTIRRRGVDLLTAEADLGAPSESPHKLFDQKIFNSGGLGDLGFASPLWLQRVNERIVSQRTASVRLQLRSSSFDPLSSWVGTRASVGEWQSFDVQGLRYLLPVGVAGPLWALRSFGLRYL